MNKYLSKTDSKDNPKKIGWVEINRKIVRFITIQSWPQSDANDFVIIDILLSLELELWGWSKISVVSNVRITSSYSNRHEITNSVIEIPEGRVQPPELQVTLHLSVHSLYGCGETAAHATFSPNIRWISGVWSLFCCCCCCTWKATES